MRDWAGGPALRREGAALIDVLFVTRIGDPMDAGSEDVYRPLRLEIQGRTADIPSLLRLLKQPGAASTVPRSPGFRSFQVLTPFYIEEFLRRRGQSVQQIACLEDEQKRVRDCVRTGVRVIALCTTWLSGLNAAAELRQAAARLRAVAPRVPIIVGGIGVRKSLRLLELLEQRRLPGILPDWLTRSRLTQSASWRLIRKKLRPHFLLIDPRADRDFDALVLSDGGELTLAAIVNRLRDGRDFRDLPNLAIPSGSRYQFTPTSPESIDIDSEIVDWRRFEEDLNDLEVPVRCGTGCPYKCGFCDFMRLQDLHFRSVESLVAELRSVTSALPPPHLVHFVDDNLGANRKRLVDLAKLILSERLDIGWRAFLRADVIDADTAFLMRESGCYEAHLGIESGDVQVLRNMNKYLDPDKALQGIVNLNAVGIRTLNTFVVGFPGECERSIRRTADFISSIPSGKRTGTFHRYYLFRLIVSPLSPVASPEQRTRFGLKGIGEEWAHRTMNAAEAKAAVREIFLNVDGPSHFYPERLPRTWTASGIRRVLGMRDEVQKGRLEGRDGKGVERLLAAVRLAEEQAPGASSRRPWVCELCADT